MATATELLVAAELRDLIEVSRDQQGWSVLSLTSTTFVLGLPAADATKFWLRCDCEGYSALPPIWQWCDFQGGNRDQQNLIPKNGKSGFFHKAGVICAPWSRLAYRSIDLRGPHSDWNIGNWKANQHTRQCTTLAAMAVRIAIELQARFDGRMEELRAVA